VAPGYGILWTVNLPISRTFLKSNIEMFRSFFIPIRLHFWAIFGALLAVTSIHAQPQPLGGGVGWTSFPVSFKIQSPTNVPESERYWFTNNIYHCQVFSNDDTFEAGNTDTQPRTEQRFEPDYTNGGSQPIGEIQYQSMEMAPSNENSYCIFQLHTGDAESTAFGSTTFMIFWFTNNNGSVWDYSGHEMVKNLGNQWFQVNVDHNLVNHAIKVWINQTLVWTQQDNLALDWYPKDGDYEQYHNPTYEQDTYITNILMWTNSGSPLVPLTWTGTTNGANDGTWDVDADTNWVNSTNRLPQFYQDLGTTFFNSSAPPGQTSTPFVLGSSTVTFDDSAPGTTTVNLLGLLQPASVTVSNNLKSYSFNGPGNIGGTSTLTKTGTGTLTLNINNTYTGNTIINEGALALPGAVTIPDTPAIVIAGGATLSLFPRTAGFGLGSGQVLSNSTSTAIISGGMKTSSGTLALRYAAGTPSLMATNGALTLSSTTVLIINNTGPPLTAGIYTIISTNLGGAVNGTLPSSFTVNGGGIATGATASLAINGGALDLVVSVPTPHITGISINGTTLIITATNGADGGQFVLMGSTNLLLPFSQWTPVLTNNFNGNGNLDLTNVINTSNPLEFYILWQ
jgi:autotransporter-associated beta strand protein